MIRRFVIRCLAPLALTFVLSVSAPSAVRAQNGNFPEPPQEGDSSGRPFDGYFVAGVLAFGALFAVAKTARR